MKNTMTKINSLTMTKINSLTMPKDQYTKNIVIAGICLLVVIASMYMYFVGKIVFDVVARKQAESSIKFAQSSVGKLQVEYLSELTSLDIASASSNGLAESMDTLYATRASTSPTVGMLQ